MESRSTRWRFLRFSLRALVVMITLAALALGWLSYTARQRAAALVAVRSAGGNVRMSLGRPSYLQQIYGQDAFGEVHSIDLREGQVDNALLQQIAVLTELRELDLSSADINDEGVALLAGMPLRVLWLQSTNITDASAATLSRMQQLTDLHLNATSLGDRFLEQLAPLPQLEYLGLRGTQVTGAGIPHLARHPSLQKLDVYRTDVDDAGVESLTACQQLTRLGLSMTNVTNEVFASLAKLPHLTDVDLSANRPVTTEAVLEFEKAHPTCDIEWYGK